ncbi:MAG: hypothetical protein HY861_01440 [Chlamydiia bacterium]|nr:hypothetical protein [Chlamydiia bacterium]
MLRIITCLVLLFLSSTLHPSPLQERLKTAQSGDYLVLEGGKRFTVISVHSITCSSLVLEEISVPSSHLKAPPPSWPEWVEAGAPGHSSWSMIELDIPNGTILECYSFTRQAWIQIAPNESLLATLLRLPLSPLSYDKRRHIGPPPPHGELDTRKLWEPPIVFEGQKKMDVHCDAYETTWPQDNSVLAGTTLLLYFDRDLCFPFPSWIQIEATPLALSLRAIDAGKNLPSPHHFFPRRTPEFVGSAQKLGNSLRLVIKSPKYFKKFELFAVDITSCSKQIHPIPTVLEIHEDGTLSLDIANEILNQTLTPSHRYTWLIMPEGYSQSYSETSRPFLWE